MQAISEYSGILNVHNTLISLVWRIRNKANWNTKYFNILEDKQKDIKWDIKNSKCGEEHSGMIESFIIIVFVILYCY
jgi:hypothetical protein